MKRSQQRKFGSVVLLLALGCMVAPVAFADPMTGGNPPYEDCAPPCATSCYIPPVRSAWYFQTDALALRRDPYGNTPFASLGNTTPAPIVFSTADLDRQFKGGVELTIGHTFGESPYQIEGSYFAIDSWNTSASIHSNSDNLYSPFSNFGNPNAIAPFDPNNVASVQSQSNLQNGELNMKYLLPMPQNGMNASFLVGVRYMNIEESLGYQTYQQASPATPAVNIHTRTTNDLLGPQIGGYFEFYSKYNSWISFEMKGALCGNNAMQSNDVISDPSITSGRNDGFSTSFVGDLELMFNWRIRPHFVTRFGYQAMWVTGVAMASRNFGPAALGQDASFGPASLDADGTVVYHGPHLGMEFSW